MTTPEQMPAEDTLRQIREMLAKADPDRVRKLLWDIRTSHLTNKDMAETLH